MTRLPAGSLRGVNHGAMERIRRTPRAACAVVLAGALLLTLGGMAAGQTEPIADPFDPSLDFAQVAFVDVVVIDAGTVNVAVTVRHDDEGWDHYADAWQIVDPASEEVLAERELLHPHVNEQPFTRSLFDVALPDGIDRILARARCNVHGFGGREVLVDLNASEGEGFTVRR